MAPTEVDVIHSRGKDCMKRTGPCRGILVHFLMFGESEENRVMNK